MSWFNQMFPLWDSWHFETGNDPFESSSELHTLYVDDEVQGPDWPTVASEAFDRIHASEYRDRGRTITVLVFLGMPAVNHFMGAKLQIECLRDVFYRKFLIYPPDVRYTNGGGVWRSRRFHLASPIIWEHFACRASTPDSVSETCVGVFLWPLQLHCGSSPLEPLKNARKAHRGACTP
jgi:hypothetical protein